MSIALKGKRAPIHSRMVAGYSGPKLDWMMAQGLTWRGIRPEGWRPRPKGLKAWLFFVFVMIPRGIVK